MKHFGLLVACLCVTAALLAQDKPAGTPAPAQPPPGEAKPPEPEPAREPVYLRRFSLGVTGSAPFMLLLQGGQRTTETATPPQATDFKTSQKKHYVGGGAAVQFALFDRWAINIHGIARTAEYDSFRIFYSGTDNTNTVIDERTQTGITESTKARYFDFPVMVRRFNKGHHDYKHRWFFEAGPSVRYVSKIRTQNTYTDSKGGQTSDALPPPYKKSIVGATAGIGGVLIDPVGVRITPEVRYTRWLGATFDVPPTRSRRDQVEFVITIGF